MPTFEQASLKPGRYHLGSGIYRDLSSQDIARFVSGTKKLLADGHGVPVLFEHAPPGSADGAPQQFSSTDPRDRRADQVRHGAGWLKGIKLASDGAAVCTLEATDPKAVEGLRNGSIRFTSPELRPNWTDGKGRTYANLISHLALTHRPRNSEQAAMREVASGDLAEAVQFSLADWEPIQMADDDSEKSEPGDAGEKPKSSENPDIPAQHADPMFQAAVAQLKECCGVDLASDTTPDTFFRDLVTALKTMAAAKEKFEAEQQAKEPEENPDAPLTEDRPPMQFSLADVEGGKVANKLLGRVIRDSHATVARKLDELVDRSQVTPALRDSLLKRKGILQFSAEGDELPTFTLAEVVDLLADNTIEGMAWTKDHQFSAEDHPEGDAWRNGQGDISPEQAKKLVDEQAKRIPQLRRQTTESV